MEVLLKPGDVFLTRGTGLLSGLIRVCTQSFGEKRSKVNHVGVVVQEGDVRNAVVVEALIKVRKHRLWETYGPPRNRGRGQVFILGVFFTLAVRFAMILMVEQSSSTKPATSLSLYL